MSELIITIDQLLKKIHTETLKIKTEKSDCQKFYYEVLFLNIRLFQGALFLYDEIKESPHFRISFISIVRDIISNIILVEYINQKEKDSSANIDEELEKIYSEHYRFKRKSKKIENILFSSFEYRSEFEEFFDKLGEKYNADNGEIKPHLKFIQSTYDRIRYIESRLKKDDKHSIRILYMWYTNFSKIAHFGELTIRQIADMYNDDEKMKNKYYDYLLTTLTRNIFGLFSKVIHEDSYDESIILDIEKILEFENEIN